MEPIDNKEQINCPYCHELISIHAKKCKHCNEIVDVQMREIDMLKKQQLRHDSNIIVNNNNNLSSVTSISKKKFPHIAHLIMTILTGGLWAFVWLIHYIMRDKDTYK
ncbi:MAG: hypothetical protein ACQEWL_19635 [Pseudomonadota bacterium]